MSARKAAVAASKAIAHQLQHPFEPVPSPRAATPRRSTPRVPLELPASGERGLKRNASAMLAAVMESELEDGEEASPPQDSQKRRRLARGRTSAAANEDQDTTTTSADDETPVPAGRKRQGGETNGHTKKDENIEDETGTQSVLGIELPLEDARDAERTPLEVVECMWQALSVGSFCLAFAPAMRLSESVDHETVLNELAECKGDIIKQVVERCLKIYQQGLGLSIRSPAIEQTLRTVLNEEGFDGATLIPEAAQLHDLTPRLRVLAVYLITELALIVNPAGLRAAAAEEDDSPDLLRLSPLGQDKARNTYWYFGGTRLYCERVEGRKRSWLAVCKTPEDWERLAETRGALGNEGKLKRELMELSHEITQIAEQREKEERRRAKMEILPRRASDRILERRVIENEKRLKEDEEHRKQKELDRARELQEREHRKEEMELRKQEALERAGFIRTERRFLLDLRRIKIDLDRGKLVGIERNEGLVMPNSGDEKAEERIAAIRAAGNTPAPEPLSWAYLPVSIVTLKAWCKEMLEKLKQHPDAAPFLAPVDTSVYTDYLKVIPKPMDIQLMYHKLVLDQYGTLKDFKADVDLIVHNCLTYNSADAPVSIMAKRLKKQFKHLAGKLSLWELLTDEERATYLAAAPPPPPPPPPSPPKPKPLPPVRSTHTSTQHSSPQVYPRIHFNPPSLHLHPPAHAQAVSYLSHSLLPSTPGLYSTNTTTTTAAYSPRPASSSLIQGSFGPRLIIHPPPLMMPTVASAFAPVWPQPLAFRPPQQAVPISGTISGQPTDGSQPTETCDQK